MEISENKGFLPVFRGRTEVDSEVSPEIFPSWVSLAGLASPTFEKELTKSRSLRVRMCAKPLFACRAPARYLTGLAPLPTLKSNLVNCLRIPTGALLIRKPSCPVAARARGCLNVQATAGKLSLAHTLQLRPEQQWLADQLALDYPQVQISDNCRYV